MALMLGALYKAFVAAQVDPDTARAASEEVAAFDTRLAAIEQRLMVLTWMVGFLLGLQLLGLGMLWQVIVRLSLPQP